MKKHITLLSLLAIISLCSLVGPGPIRGIKPNLKKDTVTLSILIGQSNAVGHAESGRLANALYNYKGISTGYPVARATQQQYVLNPSGSFIYYKGNSATADLSIDNGVWQAYQAGVNSATYAIPAAYPTFDSNLSFYQNIVPRTGKEHFVIKAAWGGTALCPGVSSNPPGYTPGASGTWNYAIRYIAVEYYLKRAIRDLRVARPNAYIKLVEVCWWQGEQDEATISADTYQKQLQELKGYINAAIMATIEVKTPYIWNIVQVFYNPSQLETNIRNGQQAFVAANLDSRLINIDAYPRKTSLTIAEAAPITKGTPTSTGGQDDFHCSYITMQAAGELRFQNLVNAGII